MPGMSTGLSTNNPVVVSAFYNELLRQGLVVALIALFVGISWSILRSAQLRRAASGETSTGAACHFHPVRAGRPEVVEGFVRAHLDLRRDPPGPGVDAARDGTPGDRASGGQLSRMGAAPRQHHGINVELPPGRRPGCGCLDPGWDRLVASRRPKRNVVPPGRRRLSHLGPDRVDLRRGLRPDLCTRPELAFRAAGWRAFLLRSRCAHCPTRDRPGTLPAWDAGSCGAWALSGWAWPSSRLGLAEASGRASRRA